MAAIIKDVSETEQPSEPRRFRLFGHKGSRGIEGAGLLAYISFSWVGPFIEQGNRALYKEQDAQYLQSTHDDSYYLAEQFDACYSKLQAKHARCSAADRPNLTFRTLISLHWRGLLFHCVWVAVEVAVRLLSPVVLRQYLDFLTTTPSNDHSQDWRGWLLALALSATGFAMTLIHHRFFFLGLRLGFRMRQQAIAAIHRKVLSLNSAGVMQANSGHVVNLVSNDVRRLDDGVPFWLFIWGAPLELSMVVLMISLELGFVPAIAGVGTTLMLIPIQAILVQVIGRLRRETALRTDERVRLTGEVIQGSLAMKMLSWEDPFYKEITGIRSQEAGFQSKMAYIRAVNMAMQFIITPLTSFVTFSVARTLNGSFDVPAVFYVLALLNLPKLYMVNFFILGVQYMAELRISLQRIDKFLSVREPAPPVAQQGNIKLPPGYVAMGGADYDWKLTLDPKAKASTLQGGADCKTQVQTDAAAGPTLSGIEFVLQPGELLGICGEVGSGKSSVLSALLGELEPVPAPDVNTKGGPTVVGKVAYCSQVPWVMAATVRDNILFGLPYDAVRYSRVIEACALQTDIDELPAGDKTELGERGINLSGGQKARVSLARAAYSNADVQVLDDPLSAVDPRVGRLLFAKCIGPGGMMDGSTRVLVTHQRQFLPQCNRILVLRAGKIAALGTWKEIEPLQLPELVAGSTAISLDVPEDEAAAALDATDGNRAVDAAAAGSVVDDPSSVQSAVQREAEMGQAETAVHEEMPGAADIVVATSDPADVQAVGTTAVDSCSTPSVSESAEDLDTQGPPAGKANFDGTEHTPGDKRRQLGWQMSRSRTLPPTADRGARIRRPFTNLTSLRDTSKRVALRLLRGSELYDDGLAAAEGKQGQLVQAESRQVGSVPWSIYGRYSLQLGTVAAPFIAVAMVAGQGAYIAADWWLADWSNATPQQQANTSWLYVYAILTGLVIAISFTRATIFFTASVRAATYIHNSMAFHVLRAPLKFFHVNPAGRILNRLSSDQGRVDDLLPMTLFDVLQSGFLILGSIVLICVAVPVILPVFLPLALLFYRFRWRYLMSSREVKRLEAITRSPIYATFSATLKGLPTIRAYGAQARFHHSFLRLMSLNGSWWFAFLSTGRWIGFRLDLIASVALTAGSFLAMAIRPQLSPQILGLALAYMLQLTGLLQWWVRQTTEVENHMTSVERMLEYTNLDEEPPRVREGGGAPPDKWPRCGRIEYKDVTATYRAGLEPVLRNVSFTVPAGTSCGVVGRTGSGKSSLLLTLFRLIDINSGTIHMDGVDTSAVGIDALRSNLAIIPQDPVLFSGTLRSNLDPWGLHADAELWEVLGAVQLKAAISAAGGLSTRMAACGDNLSVGQRQLFCLARALLQNARVLALDEATANVDRATDALIQQTLREFVRSRAGAEGRVLLVIAHRIDTIMDCDQLLVLSSGVLVEQGPPAELTARPDGAFANMVAAAQAATAQQQQELGIA